MPPRRGAPSYNTLSPQDATHPSSTPSSPANILFPRSASPSGSGFTNFLSKPSKWFRKPSDPRCAPSPVEPRSSTSSVRKPKISRPTDPRPILSTFQSESNVANSASKSVLDFSTHPQASPDFPRSFQSPSQPSSPLGDLRSISRRAWSKSADDLGSVSSPQYSPHDISFQHRVQEYRNRSNSSATIHPSSSGGNVPPPARHPFPTIVTQSPLSSSPPETTIMPDISINISPPATPDPTETHFHTRSTSFTPRLPSKLSSSKLGFAPSSPKRKGSGSDELAKDRERDADKGNVPVRGVFAFGLGGTKQHAIASSSILASSSLPTNIAQSPSSLLAPPVMTSLGEEEEASDSKRTSQIVYHTGFINRLADAPPSQYRHTIVNLTSSKAWKSFKAELKGSKMYFYKPPSDRSTAIKELFPTECVPTIGEEEETEPEGDTEGRRVKDDATIGRKKRAFWGRRTHPDLVYSESGVEKGTFEALIHEAIFATTFMTSSDDNETFKGNRRPAWKDFSCAILLCLPILAGHTKFENEFTRCCGYLVSGAADAEAERARVTWLAGEYLRYHGTPADKSGWEEWRTETIPEFSWNEGSLTAVSGVPKSSSTQALYAPSPNVSIASPAMSSTAFSPNLATFSPRPEETAKLVSLMEAMSGGDSLTVPGSPSSNLSGGTARQGVQHAFANTPPVEPRLWALMDQDGLSREVLSMLNPRDVAESLRLFHHSALQQLPDNITSNDIINSPDGSNTGPNISGALFGSEAHPHWLTKLLLIQILGPDTSGGGVGGGRGIFGPPVGTLRTSDDRNAQTSRTHSRSEVITIWIRVGELCRMAGDECSWQAIFAALCSRPVARLDKVWKRVDRQALVTIDTWVYPSAGGDLVHVNERIITPWGADVKQRFKDTLEQGREGSETGWTMVPMVNARHMFDSLRQKVSLCPRITDPARDTASQEVRKLVTLWQEFNEEPSNNRFLGKYQKVDDFMSLSLAAEPRRKGLFEPYFWSHTMSTPHTLCHPLVPLLFPEPLPSVSLIDRGQVWRGRFESNPTRLNIQELQVFGTFDTSLRSTAHNLNFDPSSSVEKLYSVGGVDLRGTAIPVYDGELLLVVQSNFETNSASRPPSRAPSRPPSSVIEGSISEKPTMSRAPSIRVKPGSSHGLDRKTSLARRSSMPSISPRPNFVVTEQSSEKPLRVLVQAGTLDRLVQVLIHGLQGVSVAVADDNGETSLREGKTRDLIVDRGDFARVWWNIFRSFVTPLVFFELLRKQYLNKRNNPSVGLLGIIRSRSEVLEAVKEWLVSGGGAQDCLDDVQLYAGVRAFLDNDADHSLAEVGSSAETFILEAWVALVKCRGDVTDTFKAHSMRPPTRSLTKGIRTSVASRTRAFGKEAPDIDRISPEEFVDNLDAMAGAAFSNVSEEDLFITADLLEVQSADRTGWFLPRDAPSTDEVEIQTMYSHIMETGPSSMISELSQDVIYRILPPSVRSCIRAYTILRKWLISKLVASKLGLRARQARMDLCLRAIEIARLRQFNGPLARGHAERPCVRSFVEAVIVSAVISAESRMHHRAWQGIAAARGAQCDSLVSLLSRPTFQRKPAGEPLVVDMSWLLERISELVNIPNAVTSSPGDNQYIINLDKRRHLCNFIQNNPALGLSRSNRQRDEVDRKDFERLNTVEKEVTVLHFDHKGIKDEAHREALQGSVNGASSAKKAPRPFQKLVVMQQEKSKRDKYLRERLSKEKKLEQQRNDKRDDYLNKAMRTRKPLSQIQKQHRNKKSMSSAFFQLMRPISSAFTDSTYPSTVKRSPAELDFSPSGKPSLVLSIVDAKVAQFINNDRSFTFQLDTEDGGHYLLQAMSRKEMSTWIDHINRVAKLAAKRRLTYLGNSPKPQLSDHIHNQPVVTSGARDPMAVFGVEIDFLLQREAGGTEVEPGTIPTVIERCLLEVETRGLTEVGIYRIAGATSEVTALREALNRGESPVTKSSDIHAVCDLVKSWFRLLPEPIFPQSAYYSIIEAAKLEDLDSRLTTIRRVVQNLPQGNFDLLKRVAEHLDRVTDYEENNHMTAEALAIVFSPNLLRAPQNDFALILSNMGYTHKLVKALITHFHVVFDDDYEADNDAEEDYIEEPILEEEEEEGDILSSPTVSDADD